MSAPTATPRNRRAILTGCMDGRTLTGLRRRRMPSTSRRLWVAEDREGFAARYHARARSVRLPPAARRSTPRKSRTILEQLASGRTLIEVCDQ